MCCFSAMVEHVAATKIFARPSVNAGGQLLVYSMNYQAASELAMVLPLPTPPAPREDAIRFYDFSGYPDFFAALASGYKLRPRSDMTMLGASAHRPLIVHTVGSFEASFVPTVHDFNRLDARFRLSDAVLSQLTDYADYSFAVFKLKPGNLQVHPMAFEFARRDEAFLYFPTLHVHDGEVHATAEFDHDLYCQLRDTPVAFFRSAWRRDDAVVSAIRQLWEISGSTYDFWWPGIDGWNGSPAKKFVDVDKAQGFVEPNHVVFHRRLAGIGPNRDIRIMDRPPGASRWPRLRNWAFRSRAD